MKDLQDLNFENCVMLSREVKNALTKCSWNGRFNMVKMLILPKLTYRFNMIPAKFQESFLCVCVESDQLINIGDNIKGQK